MWNFSRVIKQRLRWLPCRRNNCCCCNNQQIIRKNWRLELNWKYFSCAVKKLQAKQNKKCSRKQGPSEKLFAHGDHSIVIASAIIPFSGFTTDHFKAMLRPSSSVGFASIPVGVTYRLTRWFPSVSSQVWSSVAPNQMPCQGSKPISFGCIAKVQL